MHDKALFRLAALAALYGAWVLAYFIFGLQAFGLGTCYWHEAVVVAAIVGLLLPSAPLETYDEEGRRSVGQGPRDAEQLLDRRSVDRPPPSS